MLQEPAASTCLKMVANGSSKTPSTIAQALMLLAFNF
jgi:hypothetical protein